MKKRRTQNLGRKPIKKRGPKPPEGGRVRVTVNIPKHLIGFVDLLDGKSRSDKIVQALQSLSDRS